MHNNCGRLIDAFRPPAANKCKTHASANKQPRYCYPLRMRIVTFSYFVFYINIHKILAMQIFLRF